MKKIIVIIFLVISAISYCQSKDETKDWIIEKYDMHKRNINKENQLKIEDGFLTLMNYFYGYQYEKIQIKNIESITIKKVKYSNMAEECFLILLKGKEMEYGSLENGELKKMGGFGDELGDFNILLDVNFGDDDLPTRMEKALLKLVTLHGGKAKIIKEPF